MTIRVAIVQGSLFDIVEHMSHLEVTGAQGELSRKSPALNVLHRANIGPRARGEHEFLRII